MHEAVFVDDMHIPLHEKEVFTVIGLSLGQGELADEVFMRTYERFVADTNADPSLVPDREYFLGISIDEIAAAVNNPDHASTAVDEEDSLFAGLDLRSRVVLFWSKTLGLSEEVIAEKLGLTLEEVKQMTMSALGQLATRDRN